MKIILSILFTLIINLLIAQSNPDREIGGSDNEISFLFSGHAWQSGTGGTKTDYRLEQLDISIYTGIRITSSFWKTIFQPQQPLEEERSK